MFIVEDGSGVEDSTSYLSLIESDELVDELGLSADWLDIDDEDKESILNRASYEFDQLLRWNNNIIDLAQGLEFPRVPFEDNSGRTVEGVTKQIKRAVIQIAVGLSEDPSMSRDAVFITQQSFGDSSEKYQGAVLEDSSVIYDMKRFMLRLGYGRSGSTNPTIYRA